MKWLASKGWDEAEAVKNAGGDRGSKVHKAIEKLIAGEEVTIDSKLKNSNGIEEDITADEWEAICSFVEWHKETKPKILHCEITTISEVNNYAGTVDLICEIDGEVWVVDFKTSAAIYASHIIQISAYKHSLIEEGIIKDCKLAVLQVGYKKNKKQKYKFTEIEDEFKLFLAAKDIWEYEVSQKQPLQKDFPEKLKLI